MLRLPGTAGAQNLPHQFGALQSVLHFLIKLIIESAEILYFYYNHIFNTKKTRVKRIKRVNISFIGLLEAQKLL